MVTSVYIDSGAWNYLFDRGVDLAEAFPCDEYSLFVTREVEIELSATPDDGKDGTDKRELKSYIARSIAAHDVKTTSVFGFASVEPDGSLSKVQVYGGFDQGTWQSEADRRWYESAEVKRLIEGKGQTHSGLGRNQADASLAVRAFDSIVVTSELRSNSGPLRLAAEQGGRVIFLPEVEESGLSLKDYVASLPPRVTPNVEFTNGARPGVSMERPGCRPGKAPPAISDEAALQDIPEMDGEPHDGAPV